MLFKSSSSVVAGLSSLISLSSALPFLPHPRNPQSDISLIPRASYSVVPVDGGSPSQTGGSPSATTTVIEVVTQTPAPQTTVTIVSTELVPAGTETLTSTATVSAQDTTEILVVTVTPVATVTVTAAGQQFTTVAAATTTGYPSATGPSSTILSTMCTTLSSSLISSMITIASSTTSSKTYDNGLWHTTYPVWSNSSSAAVQTVTPSPTLSLAGR